MNKPSSVALLRFSRMELFQGISSTGLSFPNASVQSRTRAVSAALSSTGTITHTIIRGSICTPRTAFITAWPRPSNLYANKHCSGPRRSIQSGSLINLQPLLYYQVRSGSTRPNCRVVHRSLARLKLRILEIQEIVSHSLRLKNRLQVKCGPRFSYFFLSPVFYTALYPGPSLNSYPLMSQSR